MKIGAAIDTPRRYGAGRRPDSDATKSYRARLIEFRPFFNALLWTGCRLSEVRLLKWEDIDLRGGFVRVPQTKTDKAKTVPMSAELRAELTARPRGVGKAYIFSRPDGQPHGKQEVQRAFAVFRAVASVRKELTVHSIRHTVASWMVIAGRPIKEVQEFLGHRTLAMTLRYVHLAPIHLRDAVTALEKMKESTRVDEQGASGDGAES